VVDKNTGFAARPSLAEPYYVILFESSVIRVPYRPLVASAKHDARATLPYGFDREFAAALPAMWYCLHLPRTRFDFVDMPGKGMKAAQVLDSSHHIISVPVPWPEPLPISCPADWPAIVMAPNALRSEAEQLASRLPFVIEIADTATLDITSLHRHWAALYQALRLDHPRYVWPSRIISGLPHRELLLPNSFIARQFSNGRDEESPDGEDTKKDIMRYSARVQVILSATARLERENVAPPEAEIIFPQTLFEETQNYQCPVVLLLPGISPAAPSRKIVRQLAKQGFHSLADDGVESTAMQFLAAHRAVARFGLSVSAASVSDRAFKILDTLERMLSAPNRSPRKVKAQARKVKAHLARLSKEVLKGLTSEEQLALLHASSITSFSEFPIGLVTIPPATSPLCCHTPIAYRPLYPLTRALQLETLAAPMVYLRDKLSIVCLECIPAEDQDGRPDQVGRLSRRGWQLALEDFPKQENVTFDLIDVGSIAEFRDALQGKDYDIAVISAHGVFDRRSNQTGIQVGPRDKVFDAEELGRLPPVVCLAACQVAPRGSGSMNITDLLFRQGAKAVLGTLVPVNVHRNAHLMTRFFMYIAEALNGDFSLRSIDEVWRHTATSNAVLDVILGARKAADWMWKEWKGRYGIKEFMDSRSAGGRLRNSHIYKDTEEIMQEMADERGKGPAFRAWLANQGYLPESIFYVFLGYPERFVICDKEFEKARNWYEQGTDSTLEQRHP